MKKILSSPLIYPLILILICLFLAFKNYTPGTFLTGWDTLHPEFDFPLNFQRLFFSVWRTEQGLGAVSGHSAMADLPRVFILWLFHFFLPLSFLRYSYIFLCLIFGPLGFYFLIKHLFKHPLIAFLGSLVYLFNLGTLQQFYVPFEMFPTQWAFLPWILLYTIKYLSGQANGLSLLIFSILTLFSTPQAYAAHLWYPFFGIYLLFLVLFTLLHHLRITKPLILIVLTLTINSFWLLPNLYYATTQTNNPEYNLSNRLHSQEFLLKNRQNGTLADTSLIKGFYFNWDQYNFTRQTSEPLMAVWQNHLQNYDVRLIGELIFFFAFVGLIAAFVTKNKQFIPFTPFFIIPFVLLANRMPFFSLIFDFLLKINLLEEIFRFIFTKLSILLIFGYSLFFTFFLHLVFNTFSHLKKPLTIGLLLSLIVYCYPYFSGNLISPIVRKSIPSDYQQINQYLQTQPDARILTLPLNEPSGWTYTSWEYQGSGLIWFGISQSLFDRDSDRWAYQNEEAYREFKQAVYSQNLPQFISTLQKYRIGYILWDHSVIPTSAKNTDQITFKNELNDMLIQLSASQYLKQPQNFGNLSLYPTNIPTDMVELKQISNYLGPAYRWHYSDSQNSTDYLTTNTSRDIQLPFRTILDNQNKIDTSTLNSLHLNDQPQTLYSGKQEFSALNNTQSTAIDLSSFPHNSGYIVGVQSEYLSGIPLRLCFKNIVTTSCVNEEEISKNFTSHWDYFLIPPQDNFSGYSLELNLISYGNQLSRSVLSKITISPFDYQAVSQISTTSYQVQPVINQTIQFKSLFPNNSLIKTSPNLPIPDSTLILNQSFSSGWLAFYFQNYQIHFLNNHLLVNNWANGWEMDGIEHLETDGTERLEMDSTERSRPFPTTIYILFWPQLLEFFGFALLIGTFIWILKHNSSDSR